jgi:hypothetical protein
MKLVSLHDLSSARVRKIAEGAGLVVVLAATLYVYRGAFAGFFVQDDYGWLASSRFASLGEYVRVLVRFNPALTYRPLSQETFFFLGQKVFGLWPPGFHLVSVFFHLLSSLLVYFLARKFCPVLPSLVGTFFFSMHSAQMRCVYWISALPEPMALAFILSSFLLFIRFDRRDDRIAWVFSVATMGLAMMSKESTLTLPLVLAAYCFFFSRSRLPWTFPFFAISGLYAALRLMSVPVAQYPLVFGKGLLGNLAAFFAWSAGFSQTLLTVKLGYDARASYPIAAIGFVLAVALMVALARNRRVAAFAAVWFIIALQPVLYFWQHIDPYYLAPALSALAVMIAAALGEPRGIRDWQALLPATAIVCYTLWFAPVSIRLEGRWWNERAMTGKSILDQMPAVDRQVPAGRIAYIFGFTETEFGVLQRDAAFKAFGFSPARYILIGLNPDMPSQIRILQQNGGIRGYFCFLHSEGRFFNLTRNFRRNPMDFLSPYSLQRIAEEAARQPREVAPADRLRVSPAEVRRGKDTMIIEAVDLDADGIDLMYTLDGKPMAPVTNWRLNSDKKARVFVSNSTRPGVYHFVAVRDSADPDTAPWYPVDVYVTVR